MSLSPERTVLLAGGTSAVGAVVARRVIEQGWRVVVAGRDAAKLAALAGDLPGMVTAQCDLTDETAVRRLADRIAGSGPVDGVVNLVGGWRGGGGLAGQSEEDYRFLERSFTALRNVSRAFDGQLQASDAGRLAIVSSTAVSRPLAGGANYAAVKAASEAWLRAVAQGYAKAARDADRPVSAAAVIFRVKALQGLEAHLAQSVVGLWDSDAAAINDGIIDLTEIGGADA